MPPRITSTPAPDKGARARSEMLRTYYPRPEPRRRHDHGPALTQWTVADLQLDSLDVVELSVILEDELGVRLGREDIAGIDLPDGLAVLLEARANPGAWKRFVTTWTGEDD